MSDYFICLFNGITAFMNRIKNYEKNEKTTYVTLKGIEQAHKEVERMTEEAIDEIKAVTEKNKSFFQRFVNHEEVDAKEMRDFMEPYRFIKSKYILKKSSKS